MRVASRFIIQVSVCDQFDGRMVEGSVRLAVFDRMGMESDLVPLATEQTLEIVEVPAGENGN